MSPVSSILFPHHRAGDRSLRLRVAAIGVAAALALGAAVSYLGASYLGAFTHDVRVEAELVTTGDSLGVNSDVKFRGMRVGRVVEVQTGSQPRARIILKDEHAARIPSDVVARVLPGTLFGNEYVDLVSDGGTAGHVSEGAVIEADTSRESLRLMDTFTSAQRLLVALDPAKLDAAVSELATALDGRGDDLAAFLSDANGLLGQWKQVEPQVYRDLRLLRTNLGLLSDIEPQLVDAVEASLPTARMIAEKEKTTTGLLRSSSRLVDSLDAFIGRQRVALPGIVSDIAAVVGVMAREADGFDASLRRLPPVLENGANAIDDNAIQMEAVLGLQFAEPYTHEDCPRYGDLEGRNCR